MSHPFSAFKSSSVPLIGQPFTVKGGYPTVLIQCKCEAREPLLLVGATPSLCPRCLRSFVLLASAFNGQTGQIQVQIAQVHTEPTANDTELVGVES